MLECYKTEKIMFISRALERILSDRDIKKSHNQQLKRSSEIVLGKFSHFGVIHFK